MEEELMFEDYFEKGIYPDIEDGIYRFIMEDVINGIIYGSYINEFGARIPFRFAIGHLEKKLIENSERMLRDKIIDGKIYFNMIVSENSSKYKLIEIPQPGIIMGDY